MAHDIELHAVPPADETPPENKQVAKLPALSKEKKLAPEQLKKYLEKFQVTDHYARAAWYCAGQMGLNGLRRLCSLIDPAVRNHVRLFGMNTDAVQIVGILTEAAEGNTEISRWLELDDGGQRFNLIRLGEGKGSGGRPQKAEEAFLQHIKDVEPSMDHVDIAILLGGLGGGTSSGVLPKAGELLYARRDKVGTLAITIFPFRFEGEKRFQRAEEARKKISEFAPVVTIYNQFIYELAGRPEYAELAADLKEGDFNEAIRRINESVIARMLQTVNQLIFSERAIFRRDSEDWRRILEGMKSAYIASFELTTEESVLDRLEDVLAKLLQEPSQGDIVADSMVALILFQGPFSTEEMEAVIEGLKGHMKSGDATKEVEIITGYDQNFTEGKTINLLAVSPNLPDAKKSFAANTPRSTSRTSSRSAQGALATGMRVVKDPRAESLNPFTRTSLEDLTAPHSGSSRMLMLRFREEENKIAVSVPPGVHELIQYLERNWKSWSPEEFKRYYGLLAEYFLKHPEVQGKHWLPEGVERVASEIPTVSAAQKQSLMSSWLPQSKKK